MDRVTRHLVFQSPQAAPRLDYGDGSLGTSGADGEDDVFSPSRHGLQRAENGYEWRFGSKSPSDFLDGGKDAWTPSPDRDTRLEVLRSGGLYDLRAYRGERKPSKLYGEEEEEERRVLPPNLSPEKARELEDERREVIRSQAVRKSGTTAEKWSSAEELSSVPARGPADGRHKGGFSPSFAVCFDRPSPGRPAAPVDPENIDTEQINFSAARQQFLMLEKGSPGSLLSPGHQPVSPKPELGTKAQEWRSAGTAAPVSRAHGGLAAPRPAGNGTPEHSASHRAPAREEGYGRRADVERSYLTVRISGLSKASSRDDLDSGLGEMFPEGNAGYASDGSTTEGFDTSAPSRAGGNGPEQGPSSSETPIEREIRLAMEREETLWKERGIPRPSSSSELVEIHTKPLLSVSLSALPGRKGKDKGRPSFYVQREIEQETKREEDLKRQGRLLGSYERGPRQELEQRRRVFQPDEAPPRGSSAPEPAPRHGPGPAQGKSSPGYEVNPTQFQANAPRLVAAAGERSRDDPQMDAGASVGASNWAREDSRAGRLRGSTPRPVDAGVLRREYFSLPFWKPRVSFVDSMGTQSPARRERAAEGAAGRDEQYSLRTWKPHASARIEEEIRSELRREEELQEQRRRLAAQERPRSPLSSQSSAASGASGSYSVSGSPLPSPALHQTGVLALVSAFTPLRVAGPGGAEGLESGRSGPFDERRRRVKEDGKYAGIEPVDRINTEVVESTRVIRHKSDMARRWEAGQYIRDDE
ncbi:mitotic interactor and substrate of PLK1 [Nothoprocta perdicaria]|uniref:mitotic interactor and substrate of PLK1 n=1 Tax=Nothoprocta perdicaria TaxID=30464 RepID=UPI000E1BED43|nr:mitotic interactor and substrate of PLK1 [Nothoprocta perdicaria]